jgi:hypothetical protein
MAKTARLILVLLLLGGALPVMAKLSGPSIRSVEMKAGDPDQLRILLGGLNCPAGISTNGGLTFAPASEPESRTGWVTNLSVGSRRYVWAASQALLRSDDAGGTWRETAASSFVHEQAKKDAAEEEKWFLSAYASRLPPRSDAWNPCFAGFGALYFWTTFLVVRRTRPMDAILTGCRGLFLLLLAWGFLAGFHFEILRYAMAQYPQAHWNTSMSFHPSLKLGFIMGIAARPVPLVAYLLSLWPLLPGFREVLSRAMPKVDETTLFWITVVAASLVIAAHLCFVFVGYLAE